MKIVLINHTFQLPRFFKRWKLLADKHPDWDVYLIAPKNFKWDVKHSLIFGSDLKFEGQSLDEANFHIITVPVTETPVGWKSTEMVRTIKRIAPDVIYHIGGHTQLSLVQCAKLVRDHLPDTRLVAFSMRGPAMNIKLPRPNGLRIDKWMLSFASYLLRKRNLKFFNKYVNAVCCHYPDAINCFRKEGYAGPIYMSTQVGVDADYYHPSSDYRNEIREKLNLGDSFVFGTAVRFVPMKGLHEIIEALPQDGNWKLLIMGTGDKEFVNTLKSRLKERNILEKVIFTGYIEWDEIAKYWNAIDCSLHVPLTTEKWEETFSLAVVQAMASGKPVIGSDSGSIPYQLGPDGIIVPERDIDKLHDKICWIMQHEEEAKRIGKLMHDYATSNFEIRHLNDQFFDIINDVMAGTYTTSLTDMTTYGRK